MVNMVTTQFDVLLFVGERQLVSCSVFVPVPSIVVKSHQVIANNILPALPPLERIPLPFPFSILRRPTARQPPPPAIEPPSSTTTALTTVSSSSSSSSSNNNSNTAAVYRPDPGTACLKISLRPRPSFKFLRVHHYAIMTYEEEQHYFIQRPIRMIPQLFTFPFSPYPATAAAVDGDHDHHSEHCPTAVVVTGNFDQWQRTVHLHQNQDLKRWEARVDINVDQLLSLDEQHRKILYKFVLDGHHWVTDPAQPLERDSEGNLNNVRLLDIEERFGSHSLEAASAGEEEKQMSPSQSPLQLQHTEQEAADESEAVHIEQEEGDGDEVAHTAQQAKDENGVAHIVQQAKDENEVVQIVRQAEDEKKVARTVQQAEGENEVAEKEQQTPTPASTPTPMPVPAPIPEPVLAFTTLVPAEKEEKDCGKQMGEDGKGIWSTSPFAVHGQKDQVPGDILHSVGGESAQETVSGSTTASSSEHDLASHQALAEHKDVHIPTGALEPVVQQVAPESEQQQTAEKDNHEMVHKSGQGLWGTPHAPISDSTPLVTSFSGTTPSSTRTNSSTTTTSTIRTLVAGDSKAIFDASNSALEPLAETTATTTTTTVTTSQSASLVDTRKCTSLAAAPARSIVNPDEHDGDGDYGVVVLQGELITANTTPIASRTPRFSSSSSSSSSSSTSTTASARTTTTTSVTAPKGHAAATDLIKPFTDNSLAVTTATTPEDSTREKQPPPPPSSRALSVTMAASIGTTIDPLARQGSLKTNGSALSSSGSISRRMMKMKKKVVTAVSAPPLPGSEPETLQTQSGASGKTLTGKKKTSLWKKIKKALK